ncbi:DUF2927 domain-containing protein [Marinomonas ostreistagni]|uniref:DUF2927 domain-containing protein n=1 Tax=Marinomonas ostreistagni TaxID=359209 RepID=UPI0019523C45|nr:DUF2927 domain-containing protein [Marinomonas ostreistagni]MBM6551567.1 DUF2927 domain-containing protein [Marinomonas ostreistagni]
MKIVTKTCTSIALLSTLWLAPLTQAYSPSDVEQPRWHNEQYVADSFIKIALQREYNETANPKLVRWEQPIRVFMSSEVGDESLQHQLLSTHMQHLAAITGQPIAFVENPNNANIFVIFTQFDQVEDKVRQYIGDPERIRAALDEAVCLGNFKINSRQAIQQGTIIIPVDYARHRGRFLDCIVEEITQLMGLPNDSDDVFPSIFNDRSIDSYLSPLDYLLLKILYSPALQTGMTPAQVRQKLPSILKSLRQNGDIQHAPQRVYQGSLRQFVGE